MFTLTDEQWAKVAEWQATHDRTLYGGAIGGRYVYSFCNTTLGTIIKVHDQLEGSTLDLSDYEDW